MNHIPNSFWSFVWDYVGLYNTVSSQRSIPLLVLLHAGMQNFAHVSSRRCKLTAAIPSIEPGHHDCEDVAYLCEMYGAEQ